MSNNKNHDPERPTIRFYGCYLSSAFLELPGLDLAERVLLCAIEALSHNDAEACYASNAYLGTVLKCSVYEINKRVTRLVETGYLRRVLKPGTAEEIAELPTERKRKPGGMIRYLYPSESTPSTRTAQARKGTLSNERVPPQPSQARPGTLSNERVGRLPFESLPDGQGTLSNGRDMSLESLSGEAAESTAASAVPESGAKGGAARAAGAAARPAAALAIASPDSDSDASRELFPVQDTAELEIRQLLLALPDVSAETAAEVARIARGFGTTGTDAWAWIERGRERYPETLSRFVVGMLRKGEPSPASARASPPSTKRERAEIAAVSDAAATRAYAQEIRRAANPTPEQAALQAAAEAEARAEIAAMKRRWQEANAAGGKAP